MIFDAIKNVGQVISDIEKTYTELTNYFRKNIQNFDQDSWNLSLSIIALGVYLDYITDSKNEEIAFNPDIIEFMEKLIIV
jgi:hypothetical protein